MRILLLQPKMNWCPGYCESPSIALLILGTMAQGLGHEVKIIHHDINELPESEGWDVTGITVNTFQVKDARELAETYRKRGARVVIGGPHAAYFDGYYDQRVIGEGEPAWLKILGAPAKRHDINSVSINYDLIDAGRFVGAGPRVGAKGNQLKGVA